MPVHLDTEVLETATLAAAGDATFAARTSDSSTATDPAILGDRTVESAVTTSPTPEHARRPRGNRSGGPRRGSRPSRASSQASRPGLTWRWNSRELRRLRTPRIDDDERAGRVPGDVAQRESALAESCATATVLADEPPRLHSARNRRGPCVRAISPLTHASPVFSCAIALDRYFAPNARSVAVP